MGFNRVNPPEHLILNTESVKNPELFKFLTDLRFNVFQLWKRTGAGADWVNENRTGLYEFDDLASLINSLSSDKPDIKVADSDYTTIGDQTVICTNPVDISLNPEPKDREQAKILVTNGDVEIKGNGKKLNKQDSQFIIYKNLVTPATVDCTYILETDEWFII